MGVSGEAQAVGFGDFVRARYASLLRTAYLLLGDRGLAEDLVQTGLEKTLGAWDRLAGVEVAEAYTRTTMVRLVGRWGRRRWHGEIPTSQLPDRDAAPARDAGLEVDVRKALARLPWEQRAVLVLRYFDDLTEREIAAVLGCGVGTVKSRASRALDALRRDGLLAVSEIPEVPNG